MRAGPFDIDTVSEHDREGYKDYISDMTRGEMNNEWNVDDPIPKLDRATEFTAIYKLCRDLETR